MKKFKSSKDYIAEAISFEVKSEFEATKELKEYISTAIDTKSFLLRNVNKPTILLLLDSFGYSHISDWKDIVAELSIPQKISSIFRTEPEKPATILYTSSNFLKIFGTPSTP
jgi:hypothetical protein